MAFEHRQLLEWQTCQMLEDLGNPGPPALGRIGEAHVAVDTMWTPNPKRERPTCGGVLITLSFP